MSAGLTHAGAVVWRLEDGEHQVLLVTASGAADEWVLPKGHIEPGEDPAQTARREVREEVGLDAEIGASLGTIAFETPRGAIVCEFFLARQTGIAGAESPEQRRIAWLPIEDAVRTASFETTREILCRSQAALSEHR